MKVQSVFIISAIALAGCGGSAPANSANQTTANSNVNANVATSSNSNPTLVPYNGVQNLNPNSFSGPNQNVKVVPYKPKEGELPYGSRQAPDDSVVSTASRGKEFVETRTFKSDPILLKVEKIMGGPATKYKVYLKNGKVLDGPADQLENMVSLPPGTILEAVGITTAAPSSNSPAKSESKKP